MNGKSLSVPVGESPYSPSRKSGKLMIQYLRKRTGKDASPRKALRLKRKLLDLTRFPVSMERDKEVQKTLSGLSKIDDLVKNLISNEFVIPAEAGIQ
jgi:hypothetical protein